jgi:hypothetical protein
LLTVYDGLRVVLVENVLEVLVDVLGEFVDVPGFAVVDGNCGVAILVEIIGVVWVAETVVIVVTQTLLMTYWVTPVAFVTAFVRSRSVTLK